MNEWRHIYYDFHMWAYCELKTKRNFDTDRKMDAKMNVPNCNRVVFWTKTDSER